MVIGLSQKICEGCIFRKMHRLTFTKTSWRAKALLDLVHANVCGPIQTPSISGKRYFLSFVDDYRGMMWVYFLKKKKIRSALYLFNLKILWKSKVATD